MELKPVHLAILERASETGKYEEAHPHTGHCHELARQGLLLNVGENDGWDARYVITDKGRHLAQQTLAPTGEW